MKEEGVETYLISLHVDDILVAGSDVRKIEEIKKELTTCYEIKDLDDFSYYLGKNRRLYQTRSRQIYFEHSGEA